MVRGALVKGGGGAGLMSRKQRGTIRCGRLVVTERGVVVVREEKDPEQV